MIIREANINDIEDIYALGKDVDEFNTTNEVVTFWPKHILHNCINSPNDFLVVAEENDKIIGFTIVNNSLTFKKAIVENIFVLDEYRNRGVGGKLLKFAIDKIKESECEYVCILTDNQDAINFYVKNGLNKGEKFVWMDKVLSEEFSK